MKQVLVHLQKVAGITTMINPPTSEIFTSPIKLDVLRRLSLLLARYDNSSQGSKTVSDLIKRSKPTADRNPSFSCLEQLLKDLEQDSKPSKPSAAILPATGSNGHTNPPSQVIRQIFFDCDKTLLNIEAFALEACATVVKKCLADHGSSHIFTAEELVVCYSGCTAREMIILLSQVYQLGLTRAEISFYTTLEEDYIIDLIHANPQPTSGVHRILEQLSEGANYKLSCVSSYPIRQVRAVTEAAGIAHFFDVDQVFSTNSSMLIPESKPHPAIYQFAMAHNQVHPWQCVAFQDSRSGARSAMLAEIPCVAYLGVHDSPLQYERMLYSLNQEGRNEVINSWSQAIGCLERLEKQAVIDVSTSLITYERLDENRRQMGLLLERLLEHGGVDELWLHVQGLLDARENLMMTSSATQARMATHLKD